MFFFYSRISKIFNVIMWWLLHPICLTIRKLAPFRRYPRDFSLRHIPGVTRSAMPRSRALVATSAIRRKSLRHHRNRCLLPSSSPSSSVSSFLPARSKRPRQSRSFRYTEPIPSDSDMRRFRLSSFSTASFSWRLYGRQPVQVGWPEARIASWSVPLRREVLP